MTSVAYGRHVTQQVNTSVCSVLVRSGKSMANGDFNIDYVTGVWEAEISVVC